MPDITFNRYALIINGQPTVIRSGAMHYFRLPHVSLWRDRLFKLKAAGYNTVDLYFNWAFHSKTEGCYDFSDIRNIPHLLALTRELGLWVIARPGPYINAELSGGGFPGWLMAKKNIHLRHRDASGNFVWCPEYAKSVEGWWTHILPMIRDSSNVIAMQVENEYATSEMDPQPIQSLVKLARDLNINVPLFHNDLYAAGLYADEVDLYAFDHYPLTYFQQDWRGQAHTFSMVDGLETQLRPYCENRPLFVAECQTGWFAGWTGPDEGELERGFGRSFLPLITKSLLAQGLTMFNHYLAVGCTNLETQGATDSHTSYDFAAPISEAGFNRNSLFEAKALNQMLNSFDLSQTVRMPCPVVAYELGTPACWLSTRQDVNHPETYWVFYRNLSMLPESFVIHPLPDWPQATVHLSRQEAVILPLNVKLKHPNWTLVWSSTECIHQSDHVLVFKTHLDACVMLQWETPVRLPEDANGLSLQPRANGLVIECPAVTVRDTKFSLHLGDLTVFFLSQHLIDTLWIQEEEVLVLGPQAQLHDGSYTLANCEEEIRLISPMGLVAREKGFPELECPPLPLLTPWKITHAAPELYELDLLPKRCTNGSDLDSLGFYEGSAWYGLKLNAPLPKQISILARHLWAVFIHGELIQTGQHWPGSYQDEVTELHLPAHLLTLKTAELVILVDSLGHPKGFHEDPRLPQGLVSLQLDGQEMSHHMRAASGFSFWQAPLKKLFGMLPEYSPVIRAETVFELDDYRAFDWSLGLELGKLPVERVNIHLNGILVGRYWLPQNNQSRFLLPQGILNFQKDEENHLELVFIHTEPYWSMQQCPSLLKQIQLVLLGANAKIRI